jgi:hypothetical protein
MARYPAFFPLLVLQMLCRWPMLAYRPWKLNSKLPEKLGMLPLLPRPMLRSLLNQQWLRRKKRKALADADRDRVQREQAITKRLNQISALAGGKYHAFPFFV